MFSKCVVFHIQLSKRQICLKYRAADESIYPNITMPYCTGIHCVQVHKCKTTLMTNSCWWIRYVVRYRYRTFLSTVFKELLDDPFSVIQSLSLSIKFGRCTICWRRGIAWGSSSIPTSSLPPPPSLIGTVPYMNSLNRASRLFGKVRMSVHR